VLQPIDQAVIHSLKTHYRKTMLMMLEASDTEEEFLVSILDAVNFIHLAWQMVKSLQTLLNMQDFLKKKVNSIQMTNYQ
jgi:hypothetical protein